MLVLIDCPAEQNQFIEEALNEKGHLCIFFQDEVNKSNLHTEEIAAMLSSACDILLLQGDKENKPLRKLFHAERKEVYNNVIDIPSFKNDEKVVLVDEDGEELGLMSKTEAHRKGLLHKAISVNIFNTKGEMLIQKRASVKYHWANIWSNTCCSHPRSGESYHDAASRRLQEELGFNTEIKEVFSFVYKAYDDQSGLTEHEYDMVYTGVYDGEIPFNRNEIDAIQWIGLSELIADMKNNTDKYSFWFHIIIREMLKRNIIQAE